MEQYTVTGMSCAACSARVEKAVSGVEGVSSCSVNLLTNSMGVEGSASPEAIIAAVEAAGYGAARKGAARADSPAAEEDALRDRETPVLKLRLLSSLGFLLVLMYISMGHTMWGFPLPAFLDGNPVALGLMELLLLDQGIETEETDPADLLIAVESAARDSLATRGVTLVIDRQAASPLPLNRTLMTSLLLNLIENAARSYDPEDGDKTVTLRACGRCFEVSDHGRGIPAEAQARIFEPFYRVDKSRSRKQGGSGLGLALVKAIADAHGATLSLESEPGQGTTFRVQF